MSLRVCFFGTPAVALPAFSALLAAPDIDVVAVVTNPDRPAGRGHQLTTPPVKVAALSAGVPVWQPDRARAVRDDLRAVAVDACAVVAYGALLPGDVLAAGGHGFVNLHLSLLPAWRGAAPVQHSLLAGDDVTGVSCFVLDEGMDTGALLLKERTTIGRDETAGELMQRLAVLGAPLLVRAVAGLVDGGLPRVPQHHAHATYARKIVAEDARLDWTQPAEQLDRAVRAFNPVPGAHTTFAGRRLKVHRCRPLVAPATRRGDGPGAEPSEQVGAAPGTVVRLDERGPVVACGDGALRLDEVQPAGRPRMDGSAWANGHRPLGVRLR